MKSSSHLPLVFATVTLACGGGTDVPMEPEMEDTGCVGTAEAGLEVRMDLSAMGSSAGTLVRAPEVVVLDDAGTEVGRGSTDFTLPELPPGTYTLVLHRAEVSGGGALAGEAYGSLGGTVVEVEVVECERTIFEGVWSPLPSAQRLWVSSGEQLGAFTNEQLAAGGEHEADVLLHVRYVNDFRGFAFDPLGNLWAPTAPTYDTRLVWFAPEDLQGRGELEPRGEIHASVFADFAPASDAIFLPDGSLWVAVRSADSSFTGFAIWSHAQLVEAIATGGTLDLEPERVAALEGFGTRVDLELAPSGALWIAAYEEDTLLRIDDPTSWTGPAPDARFTVVGAGDSGVQQTGPENIAFTRDGDAVAIFWASGAVLGLTAADLAMSGDVELTLPLDEFFVEQLPEGLVIGGDGRVLLGNHAGNGTGEVLEWMPGVMPEAVLVSTELERPTDLLIDPRPW